MNNVILIRDEASDQGTFGRLKVVETGFTCYTAELPWRDNNRRVSCISEGAYAVAHMERSASGKYRNVYHVQNVSGRSGILIHAGNRAGNTEMGFETDSTGCILVGSRRGVLDGQQAILNSRRTLHKFVENLGQAPFNLYIWDRTNA